MPAPRKRNTQGFFLALTFASLLASAAPLHAGEVTIAGFVSGAFESSSPSETSSLFGLDYFGSAFAVTTAGGFAGVSAYPVAQIQNVNNFGCLRLATTAADYSGSTFTLEIIFTTPGDLSGGQAQTFGSTITGLVRSGAGGVYLNFADSLRTYYFDNAFQSGWFTLQILDVSLAPGQTQPLTGFIRAGTATPGYKTAASEFSDVPEPSALSLVALAALSLLPLRPGSYNCFGWRRHGMLSSSAEATTD